MSLTHNSTVTFLRNLRRRPRNTGAVLPSGPFLAKVMAEAVDLSLPGPVCELGPGTGAFTEALLARGLDPRRLVLVEFNPDFVRYLRKRFPEVTVIHGSAFELEQMWAERGLPPFAGIISGLPLLNFPKQWGELLLADCMKMLTPGGRFVQFTYGPRPPVALCAGATAEMIKRVWLNMPPASVWAYAPQTVALPEEQLAEAV